MDVCEAVAAVKPAVDDEAVEVELLGMVELPEPKPLKLGRVGRTKEPSSARCLPGSNLVESGPHT